MIIFRLIWGVDDVGIFYFLFFIYIRCISMIVITKTKGLFLVILRPIHYSLLTHCGPVTPYGDRDLGQHWLRQWLVAWRHQAITWIIADLSSVRLNDIHHRAISQGMPQPSNTKACLKITYLKYHSNVQGSMSWLPSILSPGWMWKYGTPLHI